MSDGSELRCAGCLDGSGYVGPAYPPSGRGVLVNCSTCNRGLEPLDRRRERLQGVVVVPVRPAYVAPRRPAKPRRGRPGNRGPAAGEVSSAQAAEMLGVIDREIKARWHWWGLEATSLYPLRFRRADVERLAERRRAEQEAVG